MRTELQAKFLQHLNNRKKSEKGFTLVELLVVIIIIGILAAIALPNFLSQGAKAKQSEAKQSVATANKFQTTFRSENSGFATSFDLLATGTLSGDTTFTTVSYTYTLSASQDIASVTAIAGLDSALKSYVGATARYTTPPNASLSSGGSESAIANIVCEGLTPGSNTVVTPIFADPLRNITGSAAITCPPLTTKKL